MSSVKTLNIDRAGFTFVFKASASSGNRWVCKTLTPPNNSKDPRVRDNFDKAQRQLINELRDKKPFGASWVRTQ
jgi:hypothetical protein